MAISKRSEAADWWGSEGGGRFFPQIYPWIVTVLGFLAFGLLVAREGLSVTPSLLLFATLCALAEFLVIRLPQGSLTASFVLVLLTGIAIDIRGLVPPGYAYRYLRISCPSGGGDPAEPDAIERLN